MERDKGRLDTRIAEANKEKARLQKEKEKALNRHKEELQRQQKKEKKEKKPVVESAPQEAASQDNFRF